ncbi:MAG: tyrosine-type recombinase/integrase [Phycisphaerales bacterium]|nr:tyrosine-type recombinase/integrase [Phycisphaerales bacterium]MCI0675574.1 tyrosine-type recombinase/integrase [Phycisphaerales bacterium]
MASVSRDANETKRILFTDGNGERRTVRLGAVSVKDAETWRLRVEALNSARISATSWDGELAAWVRDLGDVMHARLVRVGLVEPRSSTEVVTLANVLDRFESTGVVKPATRAAYRQATKSLREHFGGDTALKAITPSHADEWHKAITEMELAPATVSKRVRVAKAIFHKAVKWGLIASNPFADLRAGTQSNPDRAFYVERATIKAILAACPDDEWRAIIAIVRYAGLRCPSEVVGLRWGDVNWERGRLTVRSPKTARHEGHAMRIAPISPELRPILLALFDQAEPGTEPVVPRLRDPRINLRTHFQRIIARAGAKPWPRLFQNLRASCATDWVERFPAHVVAGWLGHTPLVAARHYLQTRDAHFDLAIGGAESGALEAQNAAQHPSAPIRTDSRDESKEPCFAGASQSDASACEAPQSKRDGLGRIRTDV